MNRLSLSVTLALLGACILIARFFAGVGNDCLTNPIWWFCLVAGVQIIFKYDRSRRDAD